MPEGSEVMLGWWGVGEGVVIKDWFIYLIQQFLLASLKGKYGIVVNANNYANKIKSGNFTSEAHPCVLILYFH